MKCNDRNARDSNSQEVTTTFLLTTSPNHYQLIWMTPIRSEEELLAYCDSVEDLFEQATHSLKGMCAMVEKNKDTYSDTIKGRIVSSAWCVELICSLLPKLMYWKENGECILVLGSAIKYMDLAASCESLGIEIMNPYLRISLYRAVTCSAHQTQGSTDGKQTKRVYSEWYIQCIAAIGIELNDNGLFGVARRVWVEEGVEMDDR